MKESDAADRLEVLRRFAPGTKLRAAVELVLRQRTGALVLFASNADAAKVSSGGFQLDNAAFTAQRVAELAKMDGGVVVSRDGASILRANVQFIPDPSLQTVETGTRFRTAERLALQTGDMVLAVSEEGRSVAAVYSGDTRHELRPPNVLFAEANQDLLALERLRRRLDDAEQRLNRLEIDDVVTVADVVGLLERAALVRRMGSQVEQILVELGGQAHMISIQAADLLEGVVDLGERTYGDYVRRRRQRQSVFSMLQTIPTADLASATLIAEVLKMDPVDTHVRPRGIRALKGVPRLPDAVQDALVSHFKTLQSLLQATVDDLSTVEGVGAARARQLWSHLDRMRESGTPFAISE